MASLTAPAPQTPDTQAASGRRGGSAHVQSSLLFLLPGPWLSHLLAPDLIRALLAPEMGWEADVSLEHEMLGAHTMCHYV